MGDVSIATQLCPYGGAVNVKLFEQWSRKSMQLRVNFARHEQSSRPPGAENGSTERSVQHVDAGEKFTGEPPTNTGCAKWP